MSPEARRRIRAQIELLKKDLHNASSDLEFESRLRTIWDLEALLKAHERVVG